MALCSLVQVDLRYRGAYCLYHQALMMEAVNTSETSAYVYEATWLYIPEG